MTPLHRLFTAGFRVFFLAAGLFAVFTMIVWEGWLAVHALGGMVNDMPFAQAPHLWHAHEMIFGYGAAAVAGFLMTAAPNWTGGPSAPVPFFAGAAALWLAGRMGIWWSASLPDLLVAVLDLAFLPLVAGRLLGMLWKRPKPQQMILLAVIAVFWAGNLSVHLEWAGLTAGGANEGLRTGLLSLAALIAVLGGRVTPAFTRNAMIREGRETGLPRDPRPLAIPAIAAAMLVPLAMLARLPEPVIAVPALLAGAAALGRLAFWRGGWCLRQPILWTLHLSYAMSALGLILMGLAWLGLGSEVAALHVLGIGGVGGMTLSVMSRAALGHSGRALVAPEGVALAYGLVPLAAALRFAGSAWPAFYYPAVLGSGALWLLAFTLFTVSLWPVFWGPRLTAQRGAA